MEMAFVPGWMLNFLSREKGAQGHLNILLSSMLITTILAVASPDNISNFVPHVCLFQYLLRVPCPGCGVTRSLMAFAQLDFRTAWLYNPVGPFLGVFLFLQIPARILALASAHFERVVVRFSSLTSRALVTCLILVWLNRIS